MKARELNRLITMGQRHYKPRPGKGTKIGRVYDLLMTGDYITRPTDMPLRQWRSCREQLRDFWGLEYEYIKGKGTRCIGLWEGPYFVPLERIK